MATTILTGPIEIPTAATVSFVESHLPSGATILEVGCGAGHVAAQLSKRGFDVIGIDSDKEIVSQARHLNIRIISANWPDIDVDRVDAVVFTRSLHHISPLPEAISKAQNVLKSDGKILVEDFAFHDADLAALEWFLTVLRSRKGRELVSASPNDFVTTLVNASNVLNAWRQDHDHDLHTADEMALAIGAVFNIREIQHTPYLYRYLVDVLPDTREATSFIEEIYSEESRLGKMGAFPLIGRRIVAKAE